MQGDHMWLFLCHWCHSKVKRSKVKFWFSSILTKIWPIQGHILVNITCVPINFHINLCICMAIICGYFCVNEVIQRLKGQRSNLDFFHFFGQNLLNIWGHILVNITGIPINVLINLYLGKAMICGYFYVCGVIQSSKGQMSNFDFFTVQAPYSSDFGQNNGKIKIWPLTFQPLNDLIEPKIANFHDRAYM